MTKYNGNSIYWAIEQSGTFGPLHKCYDKDFYLASEADEVIADWEAYNKTQVDGYNELLGKLAARDKTILALKELVRDAFVEGAQQWAMHRKDVTVKLLWDHESDTKKQLDSIPGPHADPPEPTPSPDLAQPIGGPGRAL